MNDDLIFYLVVGIPILIFIIVGTVAMFRGDYYHEDEKILKERPNSHRAQEIEARRRSGRYETYIPKNEREDYNERYNSYSSYDSNDKKGGE